MLELIDFWLNGWAEPGKNVSTGSVSDFLDMMPQTVQWAPFVSRSQYGEPTYGDRVPYRARVVYRDRLVRRADGQLVVSPVSVWLGTYLDVKVEDKIILPDGTAPEILSVDRIPDENDMHHVKIYLNG